MFETVDDSNFMLFAANAYINPNPVDIIEFYDDIEHIIHIKKIINRHDKNNKLNTRLLLNHFISLYNVFEHHSLTKMICFKLYPDIEKVKPILKFLGYWTDKIGPIGREKEYILDEKIESNREIEKALGEI